MEMSKVSLGAAGVNYVKETITDLLDLCELLLKNVDWSRGRAETFLPPDASEDVLSNLRGDDTGAGNEDYIIQELLNCMKNCLNPIFVCEDTDHLPSDGDWPPVSEATKFFCNGHVYWFCTKASFGRIQKTIQWAHSACLMNGALCELPSDTFPRDGEDVSLALLDEVTKNTAMVVVSAFDGAGFVLWRRMEE